MVKTIITKYLVVFELEQYNRQANRLRNRQMDKWTDSNKSIVLRTLCSQYGSISDIYGKNFFTLSASV